MINIDFPGFVTHPSRCMPSFGLGSHKKLTARILHLRSGLTLKQPSAYMEFIFSRLQHRNPDGSLQIMYTIDGA